MSHDHFQNNVMCMTFLGSESKKGLSQRCIIIISILVIVIDIARTCFWAVFLNNCRDGFPQSQVLIATAAAFDLRSRICAFANLIVFLQIPFSACQARA